MAYPNTFADMQTDVINRLRLNSTDDAQKTKDAINRAYSDMVITCEALQQSATMTLTSGSNSYTLPSGVVRIKYMVAAPAGSTRYGAPMCQISLSAMLDLRRANNTSSSGDTYLYALVGEDELELYPTPAAADIILIYYLYQPTALSANGDVPTSVPEPYTRGIVYGACMELSDYVKDGHMLDYAGLFEQEKQKFRVQLNRKRGSGSGQLRVAGSSFYVPHDPSTDLRW